MSNSAIATLRKWVLPHGGEASAARSAFEAFVPAILLAVLIAFYPLDHPHFPYAVGVLCVLTIGYAVFALATWPGSAQRWHLLPPWWADGKDFAFGFLFILTLFVAGIGPIIAIKVFDVPMPKPVGGAWGYLAWCILQDFIFFSLILRGLVDFVRPSIAILITAVLFSMSHYPNYELMAITGVIAAAWGYLFLASRWLLFVVLSHWIMGLLLLLL